jgi:hypothetical protein
MMPLPTTTPEAEHDYVDEAPRHPFVALVAVLAGLIAIIALVAALSGDGAGSSEVEVDRPVPTGVTR